jgi:hypothetical protein
MFFVTKKKYNALLEQYKGVRLEYDRLASSFYAITKASTKKPKAKKRIVKAKAKGKQATVTKDVLGCLVGGKVYTVDGAWEETYNYALGLSKKQVANALVFLERKNKLVRVSYGRYAIKQRKAA